ncbi:MULTISPECIES: RNA-splicing ligase RtcB [Lysinibacillus]|jgi:tRNA-splicing ligase RtcB|uniref:3'-phosphate/5'-hydroxy nucleic acid ligase n=1 Tax=Lysinibacillus fusiformis TaxID=28031 RepID=A0A2I0V0H0_9BACI|nr:MULTISPECIES: RNA-splicing ligase RtcB [Lysinibacillus]KUF32010.1 RtcB protein [Lysinibacillus sp. F5]PKU51759.1 RNA-splicing ligase RtcB [Lysinibacillus fusiformis]WCH46041.1 RNA-splicing ligase RtcB [Lysinibacillus sp. OF-1]SCY30100.1 RNA-splicing ligase RtcB, repairs tRNA damage [Lysinibacillus sp. SG9]SDB16459.1 RNA-splicing ligase RtcB, repairs tRNA damage [Lysinibacillus sp. TC-37]
MIDIKGRYTEAKIYAQTALQTAIEQIQELTDQAFMAGTKVRIMPDYHAGKGCVIGTTIQLQGRVVPNLVGVDVGCGVLVAQLNVSTVDYEKLDTIIRTHIPSGQDIHQEVSPNRHFLEFEGKQFRASGLKDDYTNLSLGTLGGGNHFIELAKDEDNHYYLLIHTGSRYVGAKVANWHQKRAYENLRRQDLTEKIVELKQQGREQEIQTMIQAYKEQHPPVPKDLAYLEGEAFHDYIHDMKIAQQFARMNRWTIAETIAKQMDWHFVDTFDTIHNYIETETMTLRKGAVRANKGEKLVIPMNMRDGSLICIGKGNAEWNYSAPHGAGRMFSRRAAKKALNMEDFKDTMKGVWTTSVNEETLDEAPMAYKPMAEITAAIGETVDIVKVIQPVYNFKASEAAKPYERKG